MKGVAANLRIFFLHHITNTLYNDLLRVSPIFFLYMKNNWILHVYFFSSASLAFVGPSSKEQETPAA